MNKLLNALGQNVKPNRGKPGQYIARCPVHDDKDFAMYIKQDDSGSVLAHCFGCGANGLDLYRHLGLDLDELFGGKQLEREEFIPQEICDNYWIDCAVILIYADFRRRGKTIPYTDRKRYKLAVARKKGIEDKFPHIVKLKRKAA
jgi:hypothetical protein